MDAPRKPREQYVYIGCEEKFDRILTNEHSFLLPDDGKSYWIFHQREYERESKKPKTIFALFRFFGARDIRKSPLAELARYDQVFAIDTNSENGSARTAVARLARSLEKFDVVATRDFVPATAKPEREGWAEFLRRRTPDPSGRRCLVVDSDFGSLARINKREEPVVDGFLLPEGWQLNYAITDKADTILNKMMRLCDREAKLSNVKRK